MSSIQGTITSGLGEGAYFISMPHYRKEIKKKLMFDAYPGTLNVNINPNRNLYKNLTLIRIEGFAKGGKTFGGASCYMARIDTIGGAVIVPDLTKHKGNIIEFIAPVHVKSRLKIKDGHRVKIVFE